MKDEKDWSRATDEELIAEAKRRYPIGIQIVPNNLDLMDEPPGKVMRVVDANHHIDCGFKWIWVNVEFNYCGVVYSPEKGWAEVINQPKLASPEAQKEFEENNPGMIFSKEPKAGDMVEGSNGYGWDPLTKFTGGKASNNYFICKDVGGPVGRSTRDLIRFYEVIRLPQKSEVEERIEKIHQDIENRRSSINDALVEAIKWGQQNPTKI